MIRNAREKKKTDGSEEFAGFIGAKEIWGKKTAIKERDDWKGSGGLQIKIFKSVNEFGGSGNFTEFGGTGKSGFKDRNY
jgi:hypothetical protein